MYKGSITVTTTTYLEVADNIIRTLNMINLSNLWNLAKK